MATAPPPPPSLSLSLSLSHTHTHTHNSAYIHDLSLSLSLTHTHTRTRTHTHTHRAPLPLSPPPPPPPIPTRGRLMFLMPQSDWRGCRAGSYEPLAKQGRPIRVSIRGIGDILAKKTRLAATRVQLAATARRHLSAREPWDGSGELFVKGDKWL